MSEVKLKPKMTTEESSSLTLSDGRNMSCWSALTIYRLHRVINGERDGWSFIYLEIFREKGKIAGRLELCLDFREITTHSCASRNMDN